jgi:SAM-dependent methyltransferase
MDNYRIFIAWVLDQATRAGTSVLDYGCGAGGIVTELRTCKIDAFGCDVFYGGGDYVKEIDNDLFGNIIRKMNADNTIPFDDNCFDLVINNQVMEHVQDLDHVLSEIKRVLKPQGLVLSMFPDKRVWREGHSGIPFLHRFPKGTRPRIYYTAFLRALGFGYHKQDKGVLQWSEDICEWLDKWTFYRGLKDIRHAYNMHFVDTRHIENWWLQQRLKNKVNIIRYIPSPIQRLTVRKLAGLVMVSRKAGPLR